MYVYGRNVAKELLNNNRRIKRVYVSNTFGEQEIIDELRQRKINVEVVDKKVLDKMEQGNHQGIILEIADYKYIEEKEMFSKMPEKSFVVILDHLQDPHNFGAIIRTCEAAGVDFIIIPKDRSVSVTSTVMKTSVGALDCVNICKVTNLNNVIKKLKNKGFWIVGTDMQNSTEYTNINYDIPVALVIGSEGFGMSELVKKNCDYIARIPMVGKINSLNASVAAGIMIYEVVRQRGNDGK